MRILERKRVSRKSLWRKIREAGWPLCNLSMLWLEGRSPEVANAVLLNELIVIVRSRSQAPSTSSNLHYIPAKSIFKRCLFFRWGKWGTGRQAILPERSESAPCDLIYEWEEREGPVHREALGRRKKCGVYPVVLRCHRQFERVRVTGLEHIFRRLPLTGLWLVGQCGAYSSLLPSECMCSCCCRVRLFVTLWTVAAQGDSPGNNIGVSFYSTFKFWWQYLLHD